MVDQSEPNAQNSELNPEMHPSGARIEKMMEEAESERKGHETVVRSVGVQRPGASEKGRYGETLRPSEREDRIFIPQDEPVEGGRDEIPDFPDAQDSAEDEAPAPRAPHRMNADDRESRD